MDDFTCTLIHGQWYCPHECDDPSHGHHGPPRIRVKDRYYRPGDLINN